jgi:D-serine deaminase-like pyridoxal phosphate-dependent protein
VQGTTNIQYRPGGDEHGILTPSSKDERTEIPFAIGDRVPLIPSHIDTTINLHDTYYAYRDGIIEAIWSVATRGKVQ